MIAKVLINISINLKIILGIVIVSKSRLILFMVVSLDLNIGKVYKMDTYKGEKISAPSYTKFIDKNNYVALPDFSTEEDYDQGLSVIFIEGMYEKSESNKYSLGKNLRDFRVSFDSYQKYKKKKYSFAPSYEPKGGMTSFEEGDIFSKDGRYYYRQIIHTGDIPPKIYTNDEPLKLTIKSLPDSIEDFLSELSFTVRYRLISTNTKPEINKVLFPSPFFDCICERCS